MAKKKTFEERVRAMTAKEIIMAMVKGLLKPKTRIDMSTFGVERTEYEFDKSHDKVIGEKKICYGCAATNTICKIAKTDFKGINIGSFEARARKVNSDRTFLDDFEAAIDSLRQGDVDEYNWMAKKHGFAKIKRKGIFLPYLTTEDYRERLPRYIELAEAQ